MATEQSIKCIVSELVDIDRPRITYPHRIGYSKKGYTDGEIGRAWIKNFDKETRAKANGHRRLLLVDGHVSHYTRAFLEYAREHRIEVIGYPSHSTHVYQGLDVVIFAPMKTAWTTARDRWEREEHTVDKTNFLSVYAEAHLATLTEENIKATFRKTGVIPFNPSVVTSTMMAPSETTSTQSTAPIRQTTPVRLMTDMVRDYIDYAAAAEELEEESSDHDAEIGRDNRPGSSDIPSSYVDQSMTFIQPLPAF